MHSICRLVANWPNKTRMCSARWPWRHADLCSKICRALCHSWPRCRLPRFPGCSGRGWGATGQREGEEEADSPRCQRASPLGAQGSPGGPVSPPPRTMPTTQSASLTGTSSHAAPRLTAVLRNKNQCCPHFTDVKTEAQRGKINRPQLHSEWEAGPGSENRQSDSRFHPVGVTTFFPKEHPFQTVFVW